MNKYWEALRLVITSWIQQYSILVFTVTHERYVKVWDMFSVAPQTLLPELQQKGISSLIPIANAVAQGYEMKMLYGIDLLMLLIETLLVRLSMKK